MKGGVWVRRGCAAGWGLGRVTLAIAVATATASLGGLPGPAPLADDEDDVVEVVEASRGLAPGVLEQLAGAFDEEELRRALRFSPLPPPPPDPTNAVGDDPRAARLGQRLFFDTALSGNGEVSCATCHQAELGFGDGRPLSRGLDDVARHAPTLWNVAYQRWFFWDGRRDTLWSQALVPIEHPKEMGGDRVATVHHLAGDPRLAAAYEELFGALPDTRALPAHGRPVPDDDDHPHGFLRPDDAEVPEHGHDDHPHQLGWDQLDAEQRLAVDQVFANVGKALAAYQRRLVSRRAPFDVFVEGLRTGDAARLAALDAPAQRGLRIFLNSHCHLCHSGPAFSDFEFHDARFPPLDPTAPDDLGRWGGVPDLVGNPFRGDGPFSDAPGLPESAKAGYLLDGAGLPDHDSRYQFKTPGLRNVATSPPYGHQGSLPDLAAVITHYSTLSDAPPLKGHVERFFVPAGLVPEERADLRAFLESLTDTDIDAEWLAPPR